MSRLTNLILTHFEKIVDTEYGKENIYVSPDGKKHSIPMIPDTIL